MILVFLGTEKDVDNNTEIVRFHYKPNILSEDEYVKGREVIEDNINPPQSKYYSYKPFYIEATKDIVWRAQKDDIVRKSFEFGSEMMIQFAEENKALGITQDGKTSQVRSIMKPVRDAVLDGALYDALNELDSIPQSSFDTKYITQARIDKYKNLILEFLQP